MQRLSSPKRLKTGQGIAVAVSNVMASTPKDDSLPTIEEVAASLQWCGFDGIDPDVFVKIGEFLAVGDNSDHYNLGLLVGPDAALLIRQACLPQLYGNDDYLRRAMKTSDPKARTEKVNCWLKVNYKDLNVILTTKGVGCLHLCALDSHESSVGTMKALLEDPKTSSSVNAFDGSGCFTPLHYVCLSFTTSHSIRSAKVKLLMESGADPIIESAGGKVPIEILYKGGSRVSAGGGSRVSDIHNEDGFQEIAGLLLQGKKNV